jgi:hypothetical protein
MIIGILEAIGWQRHPFGMAMVVCYFYLQLDHPQAALEAATLERD